MRLVVDREARLPRLGWVARLREGGVEALCGSHVEVGDDWIAEAVWDGDHSEGGFDETANVFGSGVRVRGQRVLLVSSASRVDRLWVHRSAAGTAVSNSLPALLASTADRLPSNVDYRPQIRNLPTETGAVDGALPTDDGTVASVYRRNLEWDGRSIRVVPKPSSAEGFPDFRAFDGFLRDAVRGIGENALDRRRTRSASLLTTISKGYDSPAVSVLAREAGCRESVTIATARSVLPRDDSGEEIASELGLRCRVVERGGRAGPDELMFWAADGRALDQTFTELPRPGEVTVLFTGAYGGVMWGRHEHKHPAVADYVDQNTLSFCEYRLDKGIIHCPVPYLGYDNAADILRITRSEEMRPWSVGGGYDRPIPRRILNEAGIPSGMFAQQKSATQFEESFLWPYREDLQRSYARYLEEIGQDVPPVALFRVLNSLDRNLLLPLEERTAVSFGGLRRRLQRPGRRLFNWANNELADQWSGERGGASGEVLGS